MLSLNSMIPLVISQMPLFCLPLSQFGSANRKLHLLAWEIANLLRHFVGRRRNEGWRIQRKIMLTSTLEEIAPLRGQGWFYPEKSAIRISTAFFSRNTRARDSSAWLALFGSRRERRKGLFPWSGSTVCILLCFLTEKVVESNKETAE